MDRVESFLRSQKTSYGLYINYVFANRLEDEAKTIMEQLMNKYKKAAAQASYKAAYGLYRKDMTAVQEAVPYIRYSDYRAYYETILLSEDGENAQARKHLESIKKPWMRSALLAEIELKTGCIETAVKHARKPLTLREAFSIMCYIRNTKGNYHRLLNSYRKFRRGYTAPLSKAIP